MSTAPITEFEVKQFMHDWFAKLDVHPSIEVMLPFVTDEKLVMKMPEGPFYRHEGFKKWYYGVRRFVDQGHEIKGLEIKTDKNGATVKVIVRWVRSVLNETGVASERGGYYVAQTWELERSQQTQKLQIVKYSVDYFLPAVI